MSTQKKQASPKQQVLALQATWGATYIGTTNTPQGIKPIVKVTRTAAVNETDVVVCVHMYAPNGGHIQEAYTHQQFRADGVEHQYLGPQNAPDQYRLAVGVYRTADWSQGKDPFSWNELGQSDTTSA